MSNQKYLELTSKPVDIAIAKYYYKPNDYDIPKNFSFKKQVQLDEYL